EYEDYETKDGPVDYPMDGGEDGDDDDDGDSSGDDADDVDEDEGDEDDDKEEEAEHLAQADSAVVVPTVELVSLSEGTEPVIPPPSTDITTTGARITVRLQASISLPPEAEVERLLAMPTPPPSPLISLSPPSVGERLARIPSAQALVDAVTVALPSPPLPPLPPSLCIPPPIDCMRSGRVLLLDLQEDTWVDPTEAVPEIAPMTVGEVNTRVTELPELYEHDTQDLYALLDDAQDSRTRISQRVTMDSQRVDLLMGDKMTLQEMVLIVKEEAYASREAWDHAIGLIQAVHYEFQTYREQVHKTRSQMQQAEIPELQETDRRRQAQMVETLCVMKDMRREMGDMQAELLALREQQRRATQPAPNARVPDHQDASKDADSHI
ncbi:hypothetical protein Tco_1526557, partial [Tanacetum coccineum]